MPDTIILSSLNPKESFLENPISGNDHFPFTPGEVVWGRIIWMREGGQILLQLNNLTLWARCSFPLPNNWEGYLRVESIDPQVVLKVISEKVQKEDILSPWLRIQGLLDLSSKNIFQSFFNLLETQWKNIPLPSRMIVERILSFWKEFPLVFFGRPELLSKFTTQSGLFFEFRLAQFLKESSKKSRWYEDVDLKGDLHKLKGELFSHLCSLKSDPKTLSNIETLKTLLNEIDQFLQKLERFQILHFYLNQYQEKTFFIIPVWFHHHRRWGDLILFFSKPKGEKEEGKGLYLFFILILPDWGRITVEIRLISKNLLGHIFVEQPEVLSFLQKDMGNLYSTLSNIGLKSQIHFSLEKGEQVTSTIRSFFTEDLDSLLNIII